MDTNWRLAWIWIAALAGIAAAGFVALYRMRLLESRRLKREDCYTARHEEWFARTLAGLDGEGPLEPPQGKLSRDERRALQERLIGWIEQFRGEPQRKLVALCEEMGLAKRQLQRLDSPFEWVKLDAAYYLGCMRSHQAVPGMLKLLGSMRFSPMVFIVGRAIAKCARYTDEIRDMVHVLLAHKKEALPLIADILAETEVDVSPMLETFLRSGDEDRVRLALAAMKKRPFVGSGEELYQLTEAEQEDIRLEASKLLLQDAGHITAERAGRLLAHPDSEVRALAAQAVGRHGLWPCLQQLRSALGDAEWKVRFYAARSMAQLGEEGFAELCEAAKPDAGAGAEEAREVIREELRSRDAAARSRGWVAVRDHRQPAHEHLPIS